MLDSLPGGLASIFERFWRNAFPDDTRNEKCLVFVFGPHWSEGDFSDIETADFDAIKTILREFETDADVIIAVSEGEDTDISCIGKCRISFATLDKEENSLSNSVLADTENSELLPYLQFVPMF
jgi:GTPase SAR1 family protein